MGRRRRCARFSLEAMIGAMPVWPCGVGGGVKGLSCGGRRLQDMSLVPLTAMGVSGDGAWLVSRPRRVAVGVLLGAAVFGLCAYAVHSLTGFGPNPNMKMKPFADRTRQVAHQMYSGTPTVAAAVDQGWKHVGL